VTSSAKGQPYPTCVVEIYHVVNSGSLLLGAMKGLASLLSAGGVGGALTYKSLGLGSLGIRCDSVGYFQVWII
jgi:hypothetical protein